MNFKVKIQIQKNLIENSLVSLIKSHYKSILCFEGKIKKKSFASVFGRKIPANRFEFLLCKNQSVLWVKVVHVQCLKSQIFSNSFAKNHHD